RKIAAQSPTYLATNGRVIVEIGPTQGPVVREMFVNAGFANVAILPDLDGRDRAVVAKDHENCQ
ncbi:MAG: peptide chain release factor N(5)-glutamine methyltransferase, partial [Planktomarina sp.]